MTAFFKMLPGRQLLPDWRGYRARLKLAAGCCAWGWVLAAGLVSVCAQEVPPGDLPPETAGSPVTMSGVVQNGATGHGLPRALVMVAGDRTHAALTDGEGKFSIPAVPSGQRYLSISKPGFTESLGQVPLSTHNVTVAAGMPSLTFTLYPTNVLTGHISLSTGAPAVGMGVRLLSKHVVNGRERWIEEDVHQSTPSSDFRFYGRSDGEYLVVTMPELDNGVKVGGECLADAPAYLPGYAETFYTNGHDVASATKIPLSRGRTEDLNLELELTRFQLVRVAVQHVPAGTGWKYSYSLFEQDGHEAGYPLNGQKDHSVCAYLPDGAYTLFVEANRDGEGENGPERLGSISFSVEGQPRRELRVALGAAISTPVRIRYEPRPPARTRPASRGREEELGDREPAEAVTIVASRVGALTNEAAIAEEADASGQLRIAPQAPGPYWLEINGRRAGTCLGSATVTGQNLARVPWTVGASGAGSPIDVVVRTDCAKLKVLLPASVAADVPGERTRFHIYAVPRFDSVGVVPEIQTESADAEFEELTPGSYRVFVTRVPVVVDAHNPASPERLGSGKDVDVAPDSETSVVLEVPPQ